MDSHLRPAGFQSYDQSGNFNNDDFLSFNNGSSNIPYGDWALDTQDNVAASNAQSASYSDWHQSSATPALNSYGQTYPPNSPAFRTPTFAEYADPRQLAQSPYDPSLVPTASTPNSASGYGSHASFGQQPFQQGTIAPQALQTSFSVPNQGAINYDGQTRNNGNGAPVTEVYRATSQAPNVDRADQIELRKAIPASDAVEGFFVIDYDKLVAATDSTRIRQFLNVGQKDFEYPINNAVVPVPARRKSRNELRKLAGNDPKLLAKLGKKHTKRPYSETSSYKAPKTGQLAKAGSKAGSVDLSSSDSDSSSEYSSSEYETDDELAEPSPLPPTRPDDPREAVKYDTIKALWHSKQFYVELSDIRAGLGGFWEVVRTIRDRWKADTGAVSDAEQKKRLGELPMLKRRVQDQREMIEIAFKAALEYGHEDIIERFGQNKPFLFLLYQFLLDRALNQDYDSPLPRSILEILAMCATVTEDDITKTHLKKVLPRFTKSTNPEIHALVKRILAKASENTSKSVDAAKQQKAPVTKAGVAASPSANKPASDVVTGLKRAASGNPTPDQPSKRIASGPGPNTNVLSKAKTLPVVKRNGVVASVAKAATPPASGSGVKTVKATANKPPGSVTTAGVRKSVPAKAVPSIVATTLKNIEKKAAGPAATKTVAAPKWSFSDTMANLTKSKEKEPSPTKEEESKVPETAEEKAKRLRKEERRKLRVTFKPDGQLCQVRIFHHDADEELGHEASMIRDVSDVGGEGRMFKQHKDMMDVDVDDEEDGPDEEKLIPFNPPLLTDFSDVDAEERERNYEPYGGGKLKPESPESAIREQHEANTLMVFYTNPADIPPCPREPADPYNGEQLPTRDFGVLDSSNFVNIRAAKLAPPAQQQVQVPVTAPAPDLSAIMALFNGQQAPHAQQPIPPQPTLAIPQNQKVVESLSALQRILANVPQSQPQAQTQSQQPTAPPSAPASGPPDLTSILASLQSSGIAMTGTPPNSQPPQAVPPSMPAYDSNLANAYAQMNQAQSNGVNSASMSNPNQFGMPGQYQFPNHAQMANHQHSAPYENEERRRWREKSGGDDNVKQGRKNGKPFVPVNNKKFTLPCKYWQESKCQKGANCTYRHD